MGRSKVVLREGEPGKVLQKGSAIGEMQKGQLLFDLMHNSVVIFTPK